MNFHCCATTDAIDNRRLHSGSQTDAYRGRRILRT
jgi:hypothetical protein